MNDQTLTQSQIADLRCLAGMIIPASAKHGVPGADDDVIFADIVNSIGRDRDHVLAALAKLQTLAGGAFHHGGHNRKIEVRVAEEAARRVHAVPHFRVLEHIA